MSVLVMVNHRSSLGCMRWFPEDFVSGRSRRSGFFCVSRPGRSDRVHPFRHVSVSGNLFL